MHIFIKSLVMIVILAPLREIQIRGRDDGLPQS